MMFAYICFESTLWEGPFVGLIIWRRGVRDVSFWELEGHSESLHEL